MSLKIKQTKPVKTKTEEPKKASSSSKKQGKSKTSLALEADEVLGAEDAPSYPSHSKNNLHKEKAILKGEISPTPEKKSKKSTSKTQSVAFDSLSDEDEDILEADDRSEDSNEEVEESLVEDVKNSTELTFDSHEEKEFLPEEKALSVKGGALSASDPLRRYISELRKIPMLDAEEELELALKLQKTGDVDAARRLVQANLRLVVKIAFEYKSVYANTMDLIQEGNLGLMKGVSKYEPAKGARLGYYASWWIRSYILKFLLDNFRLIKVGTTQAQKKLFFHLVREKERLEAMGAVVSPKLIADRLNVREKDVIEMSHRLSSSGGEVSIDYKPSDSEGDHTRSLSDTLTNHEASAEDQMIQSEWLGILEQKLPEFQKLLNDREKKLLQDRLFAENPKTLQEVADLYGLTRERARQIEVKVLEKLREFLKEELYDSI